MACESRRKHEAERPGRCDRCKGAGRCVCRDPPGWPGLDGLSPGEIWRRVRAGEITRRVEDVPAHV